MTSLYIYFKHLNSTPSDENESELKNIKFIADNLESKNGAFMFCH